MCNMIWYGERGVVNALIIEMASRDLETGILRFLKAIRWAGDPQPAWIDQVRDVVFIVEIGLHDFGDPDLIMVCRTQSVGTFVVFVEAKVVTYLASAMSNEAGMRVRGYNSSINGQLSLKYRFSHALHSWNGPGVLAEPTALYDAYVAPDGLSDPLGRPRRLAKCVILEGISREFRINSLPLEHYHFVAMTWDKEPFFEPNQVPPDFFPLFLTQEGDDAWEAVKTRVGWIGFAEICDQVKPGRDFENALNSMVKAAAPVVTPSAVGLSRLRTARLDRYKSETTELLSAVETIARQHFGEDSVQRREGSTSIVIGGKVLAKLIPQEPGAGEHILLGLSGILSPQQWCDQELVGPVLVGVGRGAQPFFVLRLPSDKKEAPLIADAVFQQSDKKEAPLIADAVFQQLVERLAFDDS